MMDGPLTRARRDRGAYLRWLGMGMGIGMGMGMIQRAGPEGQGVDARVDARDTILTLE